VYGTHEFHAVEVFEPVQEVALDLPLVVDQVAVDDAGLLDAQLGFLKLDALFFPHYDFVEVEVHVFVELAQVNNSLHDPSELADCTRDAGVDLAQHAERFLLELEQLLRHVEQTALARALLLNVLLQREELVLYVILLGGFGQCFVVFLRFLFLGLGFVGGLVGLLAFGVEFFVLVHLVELVLERLLLVVEVFEDVVDLVGVLLLVEVQSTQIIVVLGLMV